MVVASCTLVPLTLLYAFQDVFIYWPLDEVPPIAGLIPDGREVAYDTGDGTHLLGWWVPARTGTGRCAHAPTAVVFHGQGGNRSWETALAIALARHGANVFVAEYRGFGGTTGTPSEEHMADDARAAADAAARQPGADPGRMVYVGYSLGTGVAVRLATERPAAGLLLLAPYTSLTDIAWHRLPGLPYRTLMRNQYDSLSRMASVSTPVTMVIGTADEVVPNEQSRRLWEATPHQRELVVLDGVDHYGIDQHGGELAAGPIESLMQSTPCPT